MSATLRINLGGEAQTVLARAGLDLIRQSTHAVGGAIKQLDILPGDTQTPTVILIRLLTKSVGASGVTVLRLPTLSVHRLYNDGDFYICCGGPLVDLGVIMIGGVGDAVVEAYWFA